MNTVQRFLAGVEAKLLEKDFGNIHLFWFRKTVYAILLLKMLFIWPELPTFYQHITEAQQTQVAYNISYLFFLPVFEHYTNWCWFLFCAIVLAAIFLRGRFWVAILVFIIGLNYLKLAYLTTNSGDTLLQLFIFALLFVKETAVKFELRQMVNNAVFLFLKINFCCVYFLNGYGKIIQKTWRNGSFMADVWQLEYYANPNLVPQWFTNTTMLAITAWGVMLFELIFPFAIWFRPFRKWLIPIGLLFHIFIGTFLSLPDFGLTMMAAYLLFVDKIGKVWSLKK